MYINNEFIKYNLQELQILFLWLFDITKIYEIIIV